MTTYSQFYWGGKYNVSVSSESNDAVNVVDYAPKNQNEEFQVQQYIRLFIMAEILIYLMAYQVDLNGSIHHFQKR
ncbi:leukocidin family pore-forming toxin [Staphylococcus aureus]|uniref:leukocidin family pore-forming toxin n=1 Tax=Staphylococcus aureus TaxID=1280 RepID=UPI0038784180